MATRKIHIELDEDLVSRARGRIAGRDRPDSEVIADAVAAFLGFAALDEAHARGALPEDEANDLAVAEIRAHRADRDRAASPGQFGPSKTRSARSAPLSTARRIVRSQQRIRRAASAIVRNSPPGLVGQEVELMDVTLGQHVLHD